MRRALFSLPAVAAVSLVALAAAGAGTLTGTEGADRLTGTRLADTINGLAGADTIEGRQGSDLIQAGRGRDRVGGGEGSDRIAVHSDDAVDVVACGPGRDVVVAEHRDRVADDCEIVTRQLSRDPYLEPEGQHQTQVEPDSFSYGATMVVVFQSGRYFEGASSNIGWATTRDAGRTWRAGFVPSLTAGSSPPGRADKASDPVVAYDALHGLWLISSLTVTAGRTGLVTSRSADGVSWSEPIVAAADSAEDYDKQWLVCDNWASSPLRGTCYLSYYDAAIERIATRRSTDGALTWSAPAYTPDPVATQTSVNGAQPVVRPDGILVVVYGVFPRRAPETIVAIRSTDGGATFSSAIPIATVGEKEVALRAPPFAIVDVDAQGTLYAVWQDCTFRPACEGTDVVLSTSEDGTVWSEPRPIVAAPDGADLLIPAIAVDPATSGGTAKLAIVYYTVSDTVDVGFATSADGGHTWLGRDTLNAEPMPLEWIPRTRFGRMLADYLSVSFVDGRVIPVFALASAPDEADFEQVIAATTRRISR